MSDAASAIDALPQSANEFRNRLSAEFNGMACRLLFSADRGDGGYRMTPASTEALRAALQAVAGTLAGSAIDYSTDERLAAILAIGEHVDAPPI